MQCTNDCATCNSSCAQKCPICGASSIGCDTSTVFNLTKDIDVYLDKQYFVCLNPKCNVIYFNVDNNQVISKNEVIVPVWFKSDFMNYIVCYCRKIYLKDVIRAVMSLDDVSKENIIKFLGKENIEENCLINNPISRSCEVLFNNAIEYALDLKNQKGE